jgi:hypothetical protein
MKSAAATEFPYPTQIVGIMCGNPIVVTLLRLRAMPPPNNQDIEYYI